MSWIQDNKFAAALGGVTLAAAAGLLYLGSKGAAGYEEALMDYEIHAGEAGGFERLALYPKQENLDGKRKALSDYREAVDSLQRKFSTFRTGELENIPPQDFTTRLREANTEVVKAFDEAGVGYPSDFFLGFESYTGVLAQGGATGLLVYQLDAVRELMLRLAAASPAELKNLHRPRLPEESGQPFEQDPVMPARALPLEISFRGSEKSVREFLSAIVKPGDRYVVIRSLRITNEKKLPPKSTDAKFEQAAPSAPAADPFGLGGFFPVEDAAEATGDEGSALAPTPPAAPVGAADSSRMLAQVLGAEDLNVFLRLDILQFLPAKELPQP